MLKLIFLISFTTIIVGDQKKQTNGSISKEGKIAYDSQVKGNHTIGLQESGEEQSQAIKQITLNMKKPISNTMKEKLTNKMSQNITNNVKEQMSEKSMGYFPRHHEHDLHNKHPLYWSWWWTKFTQETQGDSDEEEDCECGIANEKPSQVRIVNGENAERNEYPWIVLLKGRLSICGGSIISRKTILTAAHCLVDENTLEGYTKQELKEGALSVYVGEHDLSKRDGEMLYIAVDTKVHPLYMGIYDYDYGIAILAKNLDWSSKVRPICLPVQGMKYGRRQALYVAGWGNLRYGVRNRSILKKTILKTSYDCAICTPRMIAAFNEQSSACQGDSGGPLAVKEFDGKRKYYYIVVEITSFVIKNCPKDTPNFFARVTEELDWITTNVQGTECSKPGPSW